jgi:hypothetical protein
MSSKTNPSIDFQTRLSKIVLVTCMSLGVQVPVWAQVQYDFAYKVTDERVQVFDDGRVTRIQIPEGTLVPTILATEPKGEVLLKVQRDTPYLVVDGLHSRLVMRWGNRREVVALYTGKHSTQRLGQSAAFGSVQPHAQFGSVGKPQAVALQDQVPALTTESVMPAISAVASPRNASQTPGAQSTSGSAESTQIKPMAPTLKRFALLETDKTIDGAFRRWAKEAGLNKAVVWRLPGKLPLDVLGEFEAADAVSAMTKVAESFARSANPFVVEEYDNAIVLVSRITARLNAN